MSAVFKVVRLSAILDAIKVGQFRQEIIKLVESNVDIVLVDFSDVTFMDTSGLGALVSALQTVRAAGGKFFICSVNDQLRMLFELTSMDRVFKIYDHREAFESALNSGQV